MNFQWLPITSLQSLFAEFVAALRQCLALEREAEGLASNRPIIRPPLTDHFTPTGAEFQNCDTVSRKLTSLTENRW
jgi:hypothetical protein